MEIDYENNEGIELLRRIILQEDYLKTGNDDYSNEQLDQFGVLVDNIVEIALGNDFKSMDYITDKEEEIDNPNLERKKSAYQSTLTEKKKHIDLMKDYFETNDLNPLQAYLDRLFED